MSFIDSLNKEQQKAVLQTEGPVLILAGAGSGKTRVVTHRIAYLIEELGVSPWNILAITFTNKAAGEMRERVNQLVGFGAESIWVSTFHSMCARILRRHAELLGYAQSFAIYDTDDQRTLMKSVARELGIDPKNLKERAILAAISSAKNELKDAEAFIAEHQRDYTDRIMGEAYALYQRRLKENNALDFDDLLMKTVELFREHPEVLATYQQRFQYIHVDEYQDTNTAQFELVRVLAAKHRNLCVVGDDDQSIYKFRGANIRNILDFEEVFPDATVIRLEQNYRSTQNVLDAANAVIKNNAHRKSKTLWTSRGSGDKVRFRQFDSAGEEASFIAGDIRDRMRENGHLSYSDFAVLYRTNAQARLLEERFIFESIPYNIVGGTNFYARREIKDLLAYLRTIDNGADDLATARIINVPRRGIGATTLERVAEYGRQNGISLYRALEAADRLQVIGRSAAKIRPFVELMEDLKAYSRDHLPSEVLRRVLEKTDYVASLEAMDEEDAEDRIDNIDELISKCVSYEENMAASEEGQPTLSGFLEEVSLVADIDEVDAETEKVLLMTLHSAKGLEFSQVYLAGMEDGLFPGEMTILSGDPEDMEEERRLAYVGITRAKDELTICCARSRMLRGETRYNAVSRFVLEIPEELMDGKPIKRRAYGEDYDSEEYDDLPFADYRGRRSAGYGSSGYGSGGYGSGGYGSAGYGSGGYGAGGFGRSGQGQGKIPPAAGSKRPVAKLGRTKSVDARQPYIGRAAAQYKDLASLNKGAPAGTKPEYGVGDRVRHVKFGEGVVTALEEGPKDYKVTVEFDQYGKKVMYAAFAKLEKLD